MTNKPDFYKELMRRVNDPELFVGRCGIQITEISDGFAQGQMEFHLATQNLLGGLHGGALSTLADAVAGMSVSGLGHGSRVTVHNTMEYLRPSKPGTIYCEARVRKNGRHIVVSEATVTDSDGREVAIGIFSFYIAD